MTTAAERRHLAAVQALGCLICGAPAQVHHVRHNASRRDHMRVLPLCKRHHDELHEGVGRAEWQRRHGEFDELLAEVERRLEARGGCDGHMAEVDPDAI